MTPLRFAHALLRTLGAPESENNLRSVLGWIAQEGGHYYNSALFNPLNTTMPMPGGRSWSGSIPIKIYSSWQEGLDATVKTLQNGLYNAILIAFAQSRAPDDTLAIIDKTPWGTHNYQPGSAEKWAAAALKFNDPTPNEGGDFAILNENPFLNVLKKAVPLAGAGGALYLGLRWYMKR